MRKFLESNVVLIFLVIFGVCFLLSYISTDVILSDEIYLKFLDEKYETKYNEYKDLDIDLSDFEEELSKFEYSDEEITTYGWDFFYVDSISILVPLLILVLGFSFTFLTLTLFHKKFHIVKYLKILKTSLVAFMVFYLPELISAIRFLLFKRDYDYEDLKEFQNYFKISIFFEEKSTPKWLWDIVSQTDFTYLLYPFIVGLLLGIIYKNFGRVKLIGYSYLAYLIVFIFYHTVFWYLFDLV